jgi:hypothetical protein
MALSDLDRVLALAQNVHAYERTVKGRTEHVRSHSRFRAPGGWQVEDQGDRLHVTQHGFHIGYVKPKGKGFHVTRAEGYDESHSDHPELLGALKHLGVPVEALK